MTVPTIADVHAAADRIAPYLTPTPLTRYRPLDEATGVPTYVKHENLQPIGAFKLRGGLNLLAAMDSKDRRRGVVGYSTGNHAQSLAYAARTFDAPCTIVMPANPNPVKAAAVRALGAELVEHGPELETARAHAERLAADRGARLVSAADEPDLIAGVGTAYLELITDLPDVDVIVVPVGGGSGAAAACLVTAALRPRCRVIAVQSSASPAAHDSWRDGECVARPNRTRAEGLATGTGFGLPQRLLRDRLADFVLVDDADITAAQWLLMSRARTVAEGAGAAALAGLLAVRDTVDDTETVAIMCSGGNASEAELRAVLTG